MSHNFDIIIIGGGPGGYVAAIRAAQLGRKVALVEKESLGGTCLNWGCIPTKALLRSAEVYRLLHHLGDYGLSVQKIEVNFDQIIQRSRSIAQKLSSGVQHLMKKNKIAVFQGEGSFEKLEGDVKFIKVDGVSSTLLNAPHVVIATGAYPRTLPGLEPDGEIVWTSREAMTPKSLPKTLLIIGSGAIGIEFASFYQTLGSSVTVVELQDTILPQEDPEISSLARQAFEKQKIKFMTGAQVTKIEKDTQKALVTIKTPQGEQKQSFDRVISAVGIVGNINGLNLEKVGVKVDKNQILTNDYCETNVKGIYAIGDVAGAPWLAHKASHEGVLCIDFIFGQLGAHKLKRSHIPGCTYSHPQIASIGLTEEKAKAMGYELRIGRFPFLANGKAMALGETEGLVKTIFDKKTGELLGAHMIGAEVTELIQGYAIAKTLEATEVELMQTIFPHPTLSEMMHESVLSAYDRALHF